MAAATDTPEVNTVEPKEAQPEQQPDNSVNVRSGEEFIKEQQQPTQRSGTGVPGVQSGGTAPPPPPQYVAPAGAGPSVFKPEDITTPNPEAGTDGADGYVAGSSGMSQKTMDEQMRALFRGDDFFTKKLGASITGEDPSLFEMSPADIDELVILSRPFHEMILGVLPAWLPFGMVYGSIKVNIATQIWKLYKTKKDNEAGMADKTVQEVIKENMGKEPERTNWKLGRDGFYLKDRAGNYLKRTDASDAKKLEKPKIADIKNVFAANGASATCKAYEITETELETKHGIDLQE